MEMLRSIISGVVGWLEDMHGKVWLNSSYSKD